MRAIYIVVGFFLGALTVIPYCQRVNDRLSEAWHMYAIKVAVMAYYEGHTKGMAQSEIRTLDNYGSCFEELDQLRAIIRKKEGK